MTLLGDAAHPMLQYYAQGAAMALEDAICLAAEIERAACDFETAFQAYQHSRFMRTGRVQLTARFIGDWIFHASGVQRLLRNEMLGARTQEQFLDGFRWLYGYELPQLKRIVGVGTTETNETKTDRGNGCIHSDVARTRLR